MHVTAGNQMTNEVEQTLLIDDNLLPSPKEMGEYQRIDQNIVNLYINYTVLEQEHRHNMESGKLDLLTYKEHRMTRINICGLFFAFLALVLLICLTGFALWLDKPWFAGIFGFASVVSIIATFVNAGKEQK